MDYKNYMREAVRLAKETLDKEGVLERKELNRLLRRHYWGKNRAINISSVYNAVGHALSYLAESGYIERVRRGVYIKTNYNYGTQW